MDDALITNRDIYSAFRELNLAKQDSVKSVTGALREKFVAIRNGGASESTIYNKAKTVYVRATKLSNNKQMNKMEDYLNASFAVPSKPSLPTR